MAKRKTKDEILMKAIGSMDTTVSTKRTKTMKSPSVESAVKIAQEQVSKDQGSTVDDIVTESNKAHIVESDDTGSVGEDSKVPVNKLSLQDETFDIRYGMLLHYYPKGGVLHLPVGTYETGYYVAANKHITKIYFSETMETIGHGSFFRCEDLTSLLLSKNITYISSLAFSECKNLCEVVLNSGLKEIGRKAFAGCKALSAITIPKSVSFIGPDAFKDCINLSYVRMPNKTQLAPTAFDNCHIDLKFEYY